MILVDLATAANFFVWEEADRHSYLELFFGEPPGAYRQALHMFYATFLLSFTVRAGAPIAPVLHTALVSRVPPGPDLG